MKNKYTKYAQTTVGFCFTKLIHCYHFLVVENEFKNKTMKPTADMMLMIMSQVGRQNAPLRLGQLGFGLVHKTGSVNY